MLARVEFENFRGRTGAFDFQRMNRLYGRNGAGKSSVREAIAFALAGADSTGQRAPVHLISTDADQCRVLVRTAKGAVIERSLTRKRNTGLWLHRAGSRHAITQSQLEELLGASTDLLLAVFAVGYFMELPKNRKMAVLAEALPKLDRRAVLEGLIGGPLEEAEAERYDLSKRADLTGAQIAADRREVQRRLDVNRGRLEALRMTAGAVEAPVQPAGVQLLPHFESLRQQWRDYETRLEALHQHESQRQAVVSDNVRRMKSRAAKKQELDGLFEAAEPALTDFSPQLDALKKQYLSRPAPPAQQSIVESENCPTCGQIVGQKHRERVKAENARLKHEFEKEVERVAKHNNALEAQVKELEHARAREFRHAEEVRQANAKIRTRRSQVEAEQRALADLPLPPAPPQPEAPKEAYDAKEHERVQQEAEQYKAHLAQFEYVRKQAAANAVEVQRLEAESVGFSATVARLQALEDAVKALPAAELQHQTEALQLPRYKVTLLEDDVSIEDESGCPFSLMSTGERMKAMVMLSVKFNSLLKRPLNFIFLDNADLLDEQLTYFSELQVFCAYVKPNQAEVQLLAEA